MSRHLAIISGQGALPRILQTAFPQALVIKPDLDRGLQHALDDCAEKCLIHGILDIVMAGGFKRPDMVGWSSGDNALLVQIISYLENRGLHITGAHELLPDLVCAPGHYAGPLCSSLAMRDGDKAAQIITALGAQDLGQAAVVAGGICWGIETAQGTDAMLDFVARTRAKVSTGKQGVLVKMPKPQQDMRVDMPAIGPVTIEKAAQAALEAVVIAAGKVLILEREQTFQTANEMAVSLIAQDL